MSFSDASRTIQGGGRMIGSIRGLLLERFSEGEKGEVLIETLSLIHI